MRHLLILFILINFCISNSYASNRSLLSIDGLILDAAGKQIVGANIYLDGTSKGTVSNVRGYFKLEGLEPGTYVLKISCVGYGTISQAIVLQGEVSVTVNIKLNENLYELPEIIVARETLTGGSLLVKEIPGSAHYISTRELQKFNYSDVNRVLRNIPGVNLQEEEGFGLRPNIGMRGTGVERSSKITLMEDGILVAPAPYAASAAYYFPTVGRMSGVEVRKGSSQIKYGPYTTGGAINFISTPIPREFSANVSLLGGNFGRRVAQATIGQSFEYGGFVLETFQNTASGFKKLDNGGPTGFTNEDYLAKIRINSSASANIYQSLTFKIGQATSDSDETYLGLTREDFTKTPNRRYAGSQLDNITTEHNQFSVKYNIIPTKFLDVSVTAYNNAFKRNWYKLDGVKYGSNAKVSIANVLDNPTTLATEYDVLTGATSPNTDALFVKANNREYYSRGIQFSTGFNFKSGAVSHDVEVGLRYHKDEEDRFQLEDRYAMESGVMKLTQAGIPGTESNRINDAKALAAYVQYNIKVGKFTAVPGLRYESIKLLQKDYGKTDPKRTGANLTKKGNNVDVFIPGLGLEYSVNNFTQLFGGVHKGFAPQGFDKEDKPEESVSYELGTRYNKGNLIFQGVLFFNNYSNLLGADMASSGGGGTGDLFNAGKAETFGTEIELGYNLLFSDASGLALPISLAYTFTDGKFKNSFTADFEDWKTVKEGDHLPYLANHQLTFNIGLQHSKFDVNISSKYVGEMRTVPGSGEIPRNQKLESNVIVDFSANYRISRFLTTFGSVTNIFDEVYAVASRPAGLRPGMPRSVLFGLKASF
jgi:Fe(3+) dicitrate transport protein